MTRSQKPGNNAASARDRIPAGFFHAQRFEAAARRDAMCRENARSSIEKSTRGRHGLPRRLRQARGSACRRRPGAGPSRGRGAVNVGAGEAGAIEMSSGGRTNSLSIRRVAAYTAHSSVASPESRTTSSFGRGRKERQDGRFPRQGCGIPKLRGSRDAPRTMPGTSDATKPTPGWKQPPPQRTTPSGTATAAAPGARQAIFRRIHPALLLKQTRRAPPFPPRNGTRPVPCAQKKAFRKTEVLQNA